MKYYIFVSRLASTSTHGIQPTGTNTHTHTFKNYLSRTAQVSRYEKGKTNPDITEARQWVAVASAGPYASLQLAPDR